MRNPIEIERFRAECSFALQTDKSWCVLCALELIKTAPSVPIVSECFVLCARK